MGSLDGLVLAFLSSPETDFVHCVDVTVRCNPPLAIHNNDAITSTAAASPDQRDLEDMDGWRGYFCPFAGFETSTSSTNSDHALRDLAICRLATQHQAVHVACLSKHRLTIWEDPHLHLLCKRPFMSPVAAPADAKLWQTSLLPASSASTTNSNPNNNSGNTSSNTQNSAAVTTGGSASANTAAADGEFAAVDLSPGIVAIGTTMGVVLVYAYDAESKSAGQRTMRRYLRIPPPSLGNSIDPLQVVSVKVFAHGDKVSVFCGYNKRAATSSLSENTTTGNTNATAPAAAGLCCYDMPRPSANSAQTIAAPSARHDLDGRYIVSGGLVDAPPQHQSSSPSTTSPRLTVARPDGLYTYSQAERISVSPIDGSKLTLAMIPPAIRSGNSTGGPPLRSMETLEETAGVGNVPSGYALLCSTDEKSGRDAVDVYDSTNKLVAFHLLLSPGHAAMRAAGVTTPATTCADGTIKGGRSSALVFTSGGALVTLTEKLTTEKVDLLVKKNLYSAAVVVAYADPTFPAVDITDLYRRYAEHLYRKGDLSGAVDQYIHTIGSLESSHVIFRFLDAPKIPLLVKYLNELRKKGRATPVHNELLKTCYLKLNDTEAAEAIASSASTVNRASLASVLSNLTANPKEAMSTICALEAPEAVDILVIHGAALVRIMPQETAGVVIALCMGTFSPRSLAQKGSAKADMTNLKQMVEYSTSESDKAHEPYPFELFASSFIEQPKMLRLILAHCNRNKCPLTPALRRTLLELTLDEWNTAKRTGDTEALKLRQKEAIAALTDSHCREIGDYDALVIVQLAGFEDGELLLYERLQMTPMLLERYAKDGGEKARRQMLALCQTDPEILPEVLGYFVALASERLSQSNGTSNKDSPADNDVESFAEETEDILDDIHATLALARRQAVAPPVRIARILAGEGTGQFSPMFAGTAGESGEPKQASTVPLSVALDYVGNILEESRQEGARLKAEVEEYNELCNSMEDEIESLLRTSCGLPPLAESESSSEGDKREHRQLSIDELYAKIRFDDSGSSKTGANASVSDPPVEAFWRELNQSEDSLETIARFFAKGVIR